MRAVGILFTCLMATPCFAVDYNKLQTRVDRYPGTVFPVCAGKKEKMSECVVDGDTVRIQYRPYRLAGLDTPETRKKNGCTTEQKETETKELGNKAKKMTINMLSSASNIEVTVFLDPLTKDVVRDKYGRILSKISTDGKDIASALISEGVGLSYDGGTKTKWCD